MKDTGFAREVEEILNHIAEVVEKNDPDSRIDIDFKTDILHLVTDEGVFVINKQSAVEEIWLSSPISGPYHFARRDGLWKSRTGIQLFEILSKELKMDFGDSTEDSQG